MSPTPSERTFYIDLVEAASTRSDSELNRLKDRIVLALGVTIAVAFLVGLVIGLLA